MIVDRIIPDKIRDKKMALRATRMILKINLCVLLFALIFIPLFLSFDFSAGSWIMSYAATMAVGFFFVVYFVGDSIVIGNFFAANAFIVFTSLIAFSGGLLSPFLFWMITIPPVAILSLPKKHAIFWSYLTVISVACFLILHLVLEKFETPIHQDLILGIQAFSFICVAFLFVFIVRNFLTGYRKIKKELQKSNENLQKSNTELDRFAAIASHDLKSPLRSISSFAGLLKMTLGNDLDEESIQYLNIISNNAKQMNVLIEDILEYSKGTPSESSKEVVDLNLMMHEMSFELKVTEKYPNCEITFPNLPKIIADKTRIKQIFQNLVTNGLKYNESPCPTIEISYAKTSSKLRFTISDNGIGIDPKNSSQIFEMFQRLHTKQEYEGTGIGLAICKKIIDNYNGNIWLDTDTREGSTFHIELPIEMRCPDEGIPKNLSSSAIKFIH